MVNRSEHFDSFHKASQAAKSIASRIGGPVRLARQDTYWKISWRDDDAEYDDSTYYEEDGDPERFDQECEPDDRWSEDSNLRMEPDGGPL